MSRRGWKGKREAELVECEECKRWCYLEEMKSLADVVEGSVTWRLCENLEVGFTRVEGEWAAKFEQLKEEFEKKKRAAFETQVEELKDELGQEREKWAELENLGAGLKKIERDKAVGGIKGCVDGMEQREKQELLEEAWQGAAGGAEGDANVQQR